VEQRHIEIFASVKVALLLRQSRLPMGLFRNQGREEWGNLLLAPRASIIEKNSTLVGLPLRNNGRASPAARSVSFRVPEFN